MPTMMVGSDPRSESLETESAKHPSKFALNPCGKGKKRETPRVVAPGVCALTGGSASFAVYEKAPRAERFT